MFGNLFQSAPSDFEILVAKLNEIYSLLAIAKSNQQVIVEFEDRIKQDKLRVVLAGALFQHSSKPASELREFHNILAMNISQHRTITITLE